MANDGESWNEGKEDVTKSYRQTLVLCFLFLILVFLRLWTYWEPLENDVCLYVVGAKILAEGGFLYLDVWDHKPSGIYLMFMVPGMILGFGRLLVFSLNVIGSGLILFGVHRVTLRLTGNSTVSLLAAALWVPLSGNPILEANQPNAELFINVCQVGFLLLAINLRERKWDTRQICLAALLVFWASFLKPISVVFPLAVGIGVVLGSGQLRIAIERFRSLVFAAALSAFGWMLVILYFLPRWDDFYFANIVFNRGYAGDLPGNLLSIFVSSKAILFSGAAWHIGILFLCLIAGILLECTRGNRSFGMVLFAATLAVLVEIALPGRFYNHYYQYLLPLLPVGFALLAGHLPNSASRARDRFRHCAWGLALLVVVLCEGRYFLTPVRDWPILKYGKYGEWLAHAPETAKRLNEMLEPDETFYVFGFETGLYFETGRRPPARVLYHWHFFQEPDGEILSQKVIEDLARSRPKFVVVASHAAEQFTPANAVSRHLLENYEKWSGTFDDPLFPILSRKPDKPLGNSGINRFPPPSEK